MLAIDSIDKIDTAVIYVAGSLEGIQGGPGLILGAADPIGIRQFIDAPEPQESNEAFVLSSMRNQLVVAVSPDRVIFRDASGETPTRADFPGRISRVAEYIGGISNLEYTSVDLNFVVEASSGTVEMPSESIQRRFVRGDVLMDTENEVIGASVRLWYVARERRYDLRIEPLGNDYDGSEFFAHLKVHIELETQTPSEEWLSRALSEEYDYFITTLTEILEPGEG